MGITATISGIDELVASLSKLPSRVVSGVKTTDELNYIISLVWDQGYVTRTIKPGPKTLWSINTFGEDKVLTITAPTGFIRIQRNTYLAILRDEFGKAQFASRPISSWPDLAETMMNNASQRCADVVSRAAPIDTGRLRDSIVPAFPGDAALGGTGTGPYGTYDVDMSDFLTEH
jgi:hypothetical protein